MLNSQVCEIRGELFHGLVSVSVSAVLTTTGETLQAKDEKKRAKTSNQAQFYLFFVNSDESFQLSLLSVDTKNKNDSLRFFLGLLIVFLLRCGLQSSGNPCLDPFLPHCDFCDLCGQTDRSR